MKHRELLKHCALLFIFINWRTACCAPTQTSCTELDNLKSLTVLMEGEAQKLLETYLNIHFNVNYTGQFQDIVPDSTITGVTLHEKLQNICSKSELFKLHLEKLKEYDEKHWSSKMLSALSDLRHRLSHHQDLLAKVDSAVSRPSPATAQLTLSHSGSFKIKEYGWGVLFRLNEWVKAVQQVLEEINLCHSGSV